MLAFILLWASAVCVPWTPWRNLSVPSGARAPRKGRVAKLDYG
jgi:hypothetical protein